MSPPLLSIFDLAPIPAGSTARSTLDRSVNLARSLESYGYQRYWLGEHHFSAIASSSPAVVAAHVLERTTSIEVGVAAIQLGQRRPAAVAEEWATLSTFHPDRVNLAVGRSAERADEYRRALADLAQRAEYEPQPGYREIDGVIIPDPVDPRAHVRFPDTARGVELLSTPNSTSVPFADQVAQLLSLLQGHPVVGNGEPLPTLSPPGDSVRTFVTGNSAGESARVAGSLGLPFIANYHVSPATLLDAVRAYREAFSPGQIAEPRVAVSAQVLVTDSAEDAEFHARSFLPWLISIRSGQGAIEVPNPRTVRQPSVQELASHDDRLRTRFIGTPEAVIPRLRALATATGATEILVNTVVHDPDVQRRSYELLAEHWAADTRTAAIAGSWHG